MSVVINTNIMSLQSQRYLGNSNEALGKSIERLSSGLRINHAADDASGMAISEKLRGQISGLKRASMNAQDGISMLQTAEAALGEVSSMLQRMRELAVQAANGTYTSADRVELQKEVEQLKSEINRIGTATEFNTKKLLNGDGTALWSSTGTEIEAIIKGDVAEGNYKVTVNTDPGLNQVFKTDIMTVSQTIDAVQIDADRTAVGTQAPSVMNVVSNMSDNFITTAYNTVELTGSTGTGAATISADLTSQTVYQQTAVGSSAAGMTFDVSASNFSGYVQIEFASNFNIADYAVSGNLPADGTASSTAVNQAATATVYDHSGSIVTTTMLDITQGPDTNAATATGSFNYYLNMTSLDNAIGAVVTPDGTSYSADFDDVSLGDLTVTYATSAGVTANNVELIVGDAALLSFNGTVTDDQGTTGGRINLNDQYATANGTLVAGISVGWTDGLADTTQTFAYASLDETDGTFNLSQFDISFEGDSTGNIVDETIEFTGYYLNEGDVANVDTKLKHVSRFIDGDGNNIFENKQELTIWGNGTSTVVYLEGDDTIADMEQKLTDAVSNDLGMGSDDTTVNDHLVDYIDAAALESSGLRTVNGTFIIQTAMTGEQGEIAFSGSQALIDAFSLAEVQEARNNTTEVTINDAHTGELIGTDQTGNDRVNGLIEGIEVVIDSRAGITSTWNTDNEIEFTTAGDSEFFLHVVDNSTDLQIGANQGQSLSVSIPQLDTVGIGVDKIWLVSQDLARRAIPDLDNALTQVVSIRATIGAQINRLEHTISTLDVASENMTASESRIRDLDMADEMAEFTKYQILAQAGTSMLAQANQIPQMALSLLQ